jgi:hypothetical protein
MATLPQALLHGSRREEDDGERWDDVSSASGIALSAESSSRFSAVEEPGDVRWTP